VTFIKGHKQVQGTWIENYANVSASEARSSINFLQPKQLLCYLSLYLSVQQITPIVCNTMIFIINMTCQCIARQRVGKQAPSKPIARLLNNSNNSNKRRTAVPMRRLVNTHPLECDKAVNTHP
jgi:hypothetical protein